MSQSVAVARPLPRRAPTRAEAPSLALVTRPSVRRGDARFALLVLALLAIGLIAPLLLNTMRAEGAFELARARAEVTNLTAQRDALAADLRARTAPQSVAWSATKIGMVPGGPRAAISLSTRTTSGVAVPAAAPAKPRVTTRD